MALKLDGAINKIYVGTTEVSKAYLGLDQVYPDASNPNFETRWAIPSLAFTIQLPLVSTAVYSGTIDWGDGTTSVLSYANRLHTYSSAGNYTVSISGSCPYFQFSQTATSRDYITQILNWGSVGFVQIDFKDCSELIGGSSVQDLCVISGNSMESMFWNCEKLVSINKIEQWDVSGIQNFELTFFDCILFNQNLTGWNTQNAKTFESFLRGCSSYNQPLDSFNLSNCTSTEMMFLDCTVFNQPLNSWNVGNVLNMKNMFNDAIAFDQDLSNWNVNQVTDFSLMFQDTIFDQDITNWSTNSATDMRKMFQKNSVFNQDISSWDVSGVTDMQDMFQQCTAFDQDLSSWDLSSITTMQGFMAFKTPADFSASNCDALYLACVNGGQTNVLLGMGTIKRTVTGTGYYNTLISRGWSITDGGQI